jgi:hypothetical protein
VSGETVRDAGRVGAAALRAGARSRSRVAVRVVGERVARLDRGRVGHRAILAAIPLALAGRFDADAAGDLAATFQLSVGDTRSRVPASFALVIAGGTLTVTRGSPPDPGAVAVIGAEDLIRLASGAASWPQLLSSGRFSLSGDPFLALRFASLFRLPAGAGPTHAPAQVRPPGRLSGP